MENQSQIRVVLLRDLEPIQGRSLVDFPEYSIEKRNQNKNKKLHLNYFSLSHSWSLQSSSC